LEWLFLYIVCNRFLQSEPTEKSVTAMDPINTLIQSTAIDLLQTVTARGEIDTISVQAMEAVVIRKLYQAVHSGKLVLQNKLLHLLHSLISMALALPSQEANSRTIDPVNELMDIPRDQQDVHYSINPLLVQTMVDGISADSNRPVLQHWLDFILMAIPQFQPTFQGTVAPLADCICRQLQVLLNEVHVMSSTSTEHNEDEISFVTDTDFLMLLNALERLVLLSLAYPVEESVYEEDSNPIQEKSSENVGLLGLVTNVFGTETSQPGQDQLSVGRHRCDVAHTYHYLFRYAPWRIEL
jgi:hypothetical protein